MKNQKPVTFHGSIGLNLIGYGVNGIPERHDPFSAVLSANATFSLYGIDFPFSFAFSDRQRSYSQPFNQFGISPHWKWITLHAGYRNITFSNYTLAGHTFLGAGIELNPSILRFGFVYGRFDRMTTTNPINGTDSLPDFSRKGWAIKLGVGSEKNFVDLVLLRIHDDSTSIKQSDTSIIRTPEQNIVAGLNTRFTLIKGLTWETEGAFSLYTTNLGAGKISDVENNSFLSSINGFLGINQSSSYSTAIRSAISYKGKSYTLKLEYRRIEPTFRSMGAYYFNNDLENITFSPSFGFFKRKVSVSGSIGLQRDNLQKTKKATSLRTIGNINLSVNPTSKFGIDAGFSNYSINQKAGRSPLSDTLKVIQSNRTFTITPRLMFINTLTSNIILLSYTYMNYNDKNKFTSGFSNFDLHTAQLNYVLGLIPSRWSFTFGITYSTLQNQLSKNTGLGGTFAVAKGLLNDKLNISWNNALTRAENNQEQSWIINSNIISSYKINRHNSLRLNLYLTGNYTDPGSINKSFTEFKGDLSYVYTF